MKSWYHFVRTHNSSSHEKNSQKKKLHMITLWNFLCQSMVQKPLHKIHQNKVLNQSYASKTPWSASSWISTSPDTNAKRADRTSSSLVDRGSPNTPKTFDDGWNWVWGNWLQLCSWLTTDSWLNIRALKRKRQKQYKKDYHRYCHQWSMRSEQLYISWNLV